MALSAHSTPPRLHRWVDLTDHFAPGHLLQHNLLYKQQPRTHVCSRCAAERGRIAALAQFWVFFTWPEVDDLTL